MGDSEGALEITAGITIPRSELKFAFVKSSGPGGQNVNKVNSQVQLSWEIDKNTSIPADALDRIRRTERRRISKEGVLRIDARRFRDQERNRQDSLDRLRQIIVRSLQPPKKRKKTRVPRRVNERRLEKKQQRSDRKQSRRPPRLDE